MAYQRLQREFVQLCKEPIPVGSVKRSDNDPLLWTALMIGPEDTPYQNGIIEMEMRFTTDYPKIPPKISFNKSFYHANVGEDGHLCLSLITDWRPTDTVSTILLAINDMVVNPNRNSALQGRGLSDQKYREQARKWTDEHGKI